MKKLIASGVIVVVVVSALMVVCSLMKSETSVSTVNELVIYSGRNESFVMPLIQKFEQETGVKVKLLSGNASQYSYRIIEEQRRPQADLLLANDAGVMEFLRLQGVLAPNSDPVLNQIPENFRATDGSWVGVSARGRIFMYNPELITKEEMPKSIFDLTDPKYRGKFAIVRAGNESLVSHFAAIRAYVGDEQTKELINGILENEPLIARGHTDIRKAVGSGEIAFGVVNNYYYHLQLEEATDNQVLAIYPDQSEDQMGVFTNVAGVALVNNGPNQKVAQQFIRFLLEPEQQRMFAWHSKETPILPEIETLEYARKIDEYKIFELPLSSLGSVWNDTLQLMEEAGYVD